MTRNKGKTRRVIPKQAIMTVAMMRKLPKRSQGPKKYPAAKLKAAMRHYINRCPALTPNTKRVGILLVDWYMTNQRRARASIGTIADELSMCHATVSTAIATLHEFQIVFTKSGGPSRKGSFGAVANEFVPNFWLVLNPATGAVMKNAKYDFSCENWRTSAESFPNFQGTESPLPNCQGTSNPKNRRNSAESFPNFQGPYSDNGMDGANAAPVSADAAPVSATAPRENDDDENLLGPDTPLPKGSETIKVVFIQFRDLETALEVGPKELKAAVGGKGPVETRLAIDGLCKYNIFTFGEPRHCIFDHYLPSDVTNYGHVIVHGDKGKVNFVNGGSSRLKFDSLKRSSWLAIEYRVSSDYQDELTAKLKARRASY